jgi:hypothetical protein
MTGATRPTLAQAFRRAAVPLGCYYTVTIGLPLANGAAQSGAAFVTHALIVIVVPAILIMLLCTVLKTAQVFADAYRSALPRWHRILTGPRAGVGAGAGECGTMSSNAHKRV